METAKLTKRESEIAELFAWGASKKDVAKRLFISTRTVENHTRNIYEKTGCSKVNELSAWWFCVHFNISFELSPFKRKVLTYMLLALFVPQIIMNDVVVVRRGRVRPTIVCRYRPRRKPGCDYSPLDFS